MDQQISDENLKAILKVVNLYELYELFEERGLGKKFKFHKIL